MFTARQSLAASGLILTLALTSQVSANESGFYLSTALWPQNTVPVCWENGSAGTATEQQWVQSRIEATWEANSAIDFTGWANCDARTNSGIRIHINDSTPLVRGLGRRGSNVRNGMVLNFTYQKWGCSGPCKHTEEERRSYIETNAIHEFGHALGIAHEHNRSDRPDSCTDAPAGTMGDTTVGPWDADSIMNYCFGGFASNRLSAGDIITIQQMYPSTGAISLDINGDGLSDLATFSDAKAMLRIANADGSFSSRMYAPWPGYAVGSASFFLSGDFNGDGRGDLLHLVEGGGYVHPWFGTAAGDFSVGYFKPWDDYRIDGKNSFRVGDFDGDGRDDLAHFVGTYTHLWHSRGDGTFAVSTFVPWSGYAIGGAYQYKTGDFDGDGRDDLVHVVEGSGYVNLWRGQATGGFAVTSFAPWAGYTIGNAHQYGVGDFNGDERSDLMHFVAGRDYAHPWYGTPEGGFSLSGVMPWSGYRIGMAYQYLVGDFNADGSDDLAHIIEGSDYVHTWTSSRSGPFSFGTFRPWSGYAVGTGYDYVAGEFNRDARVDLVHAWGPRKTYLNEWLSNGDTSFSVVPR